MIDLELLRKQKEKIFESQGRRGKDTTIIDNCIALDLRWKQCKFIN